MSGTGGSDSDGRTFSSAAEMWREEIGEGNLPENDPKVKKKCPKVEQWYKKGVSYWEGIEASVDGVLGGYGGVNDLDVLGSNAFLRDVWGGRLREAQAAGETLVALDCGAGVGRVTKNFLLSVFNEVDLVEPVEHFLAAARSDLEASCCDGSHRAANFFCCPLQEFVPVSGRYDVIWIQWCIGHLIDSDLIQFLSRCQDGLKPGGLVILKENTTRTGFVLDRVDNSVTRSDAYFKKLFDRAGLRLMKSKAQKGFPEELFPVRMYALAPPSTSSSAAQILKRKRKNTPAVID